MKFFRKKIKSASLLVFVGIIILCFVYRASIYYAAAITYHDLISYPDNAFCASIRIADSKQAKFVVHPFKGTDGFYIPIPQNWHLDSLFVSVDGGDFKGINLAIGGVVEITGKGVLFFERTESFHVCQISQNTIFINTESGTMDKINADITKEHYEGGSIMFINNNGEIEYSDKFPDIHGHGNATWEGKGKKSYNIKLYDKINAFGFVGEKSFSLIANASDNSSLKNWASYRLCDLSSMPYVIKYGFTSVFLNGHYNGLYLITNKIKQGKKHLALNDLEAQTQSVNKKKLKKMEVVKIDADGNLLLNNNYSFDVYRSGLRDANNPNNISGGYIIESHSRLGRPVGSFMTSMGCRKSLRYPKYPTIEQVNYISSYYDEAELAAINPNGINPKTGKHYTEYFDLNSFAKYYLIQELMLNRDQELASFFMYKDVDDCRFYAGPVWDMDGTRNGRIYNIPNCYSMKAGIMSPNNSKSASFRSSSYKGIYYSLFQHDEFQEIVKNTYYLEVSKAAHRLFEQDLDSITSLMQNDHYLNGLKWNLSTNMKQQAYEMKKFYLQRIAFLDNDMRLDHKLYHTVIFDDESNTDYAYHLLEFHVKDGDFLIIPGFEEEIEKGRILIMPEKRKFTSKTKITSDLILKNTPL